MVTRLITVQVHQITQRSRTERSTHVELQSFSSKVYFQAGLMQVI